MNSAQFTRANPKLTWARAEKLCREHGETVAAFRMDNPRACYWGKYDTAAMLAWLGY